MAGGRAQRRTRRVPPPVHDHAPHGAASLQVRLFLALLLVFSTGQYPSCYGNGGHGGAAPGGAETAGGGKCMEREREAVLAVRDDVWGVTDRDQRLPSWERDDDCCRWEGIACDHWSGHVVKLDLRFYPEYGDAPAGSSKVNPSLLNLGSLRYLDLSGNDFSGSPLPSFIGSLVNLEYLNISDANFAGSVPLELGNLQNLKSLDLSSSFSYGTTVENLRWLSHLSHLQYLDMSWFDLSAAHDWLQVISMLPSLSLLRLQDCYLPNPPPSTILFPLGNFTSLSTLDLGGYSLAYSTWPLWLSNISSLTTLVLNNYRNCTVPPEAFKNMKHLEVLTMYGLNGLIPRFLWRLDKLKTLHLTGVLDLRIGSSEDMGHLSSLRELTLSGVVGRLPDSLGNITGLQSLSIQTDVTSMELPKSIGNFSRLEHLEVISVYNAMGGWLPESTGKLVGLKTLRVSGLNTSGEVLRNMGDLCNLTELTIKGNKADGAEVTKLLEGLCECIGGSALEQLDISGNGYRGHLPYQLGKLKNLRYVDLSANSIDGSIPASIGELKSWTHLDLSFNQLSGLVPSSIGKLSNLTFMGLSNNRLEGDLSEAHFSHLSQLDRVYLSNNAALSLNISPTWIPPFQLSTFDMSTCHVGPEFPKWLQTQKKLDWLDLSSNNISCSSTVEDDLFNNLSSKMSYFNLSNNDIKGSIPSSICQIKSLEILDLSYNHFSGQIPDCWRGRGLVAMDFSSNSLVGHIPSSIGMLSKLKSLHLDKNALTGSIPPSLKKCTMLKSLDLSKNNFSGEIPSWLGQSLSSLWILRLRSNMFHGYLPMSLSRLQSLKILDLAHNNLSGSILLSFHNLTQMIIIEKFDLLTYWLLYASEMGSMEKRSIMPKGTELEYTLNLPLVTMIDLSSNNFSGEFPREITNLHGLRFLNLSNNHLSGGIPENLSTMELLESLDLSFNQLSGSVPSTMSTMHFLSFLNLSYNSLFGIIPKGQIETFDQYSFIGNHGLCGAPILGPCPRDATSFQSPFQTSEGDASHEHESYMAWFYVSLGPGFVTGFLGFLGVLSLMRRSWRIAYFRFFDCLGDTLYVFVVVRYARLKVKLSAWRGGGSSG